MAAILSSRGMFSGIEWRWDMDVRRMVATGQQLMNLEGEGGTDT